MTVEIADFFKKNKNKIILFVNLILISSFSFMAGSFYAYRQTNHQEIKFENTEDICPGFFVKDITEDSLKGTVRGGQNKNTLQSGVGESELKKSAAAEKDISDEKERMFVGSKNSKIYHKPDCSYAKKILDKNKIWFSSKEDAESKGYRAGKCCHP